MITVISPLMLEISDSKHCKPPEIPTISTQSYTHTPNKEHKLQASLNSRNIKMMPPQCHIMSSLVSSEQVSELSVLLLSSGGFLQFAQNHFLAIFSLIKTLQVAVDVRKLAINPMRLISNMTSISLSILLGISESEWLNHRSKAVGAYSSPPVRDKLLLVMINPCTDLLSS
jgi:hypothetical protein